jgi:uncharacterized protein (TIGR02246 family)
MSVRKGLFVSVITLSALAYSSTAGIADERLEARQVAESVVKSFMAGYNAHDPKAISTLFLPDAMLLGTDGKVTQGREAIERTYAATLKNLGGHFTVVIKDAIPLGETSLSQMTK